MPSDAERGDIISSTYYSDKSVTDPRRSGYEYKLTPEDQTRENEIYQELFDLSYDKLVGSSSWERSGEEERAELLDEMMSKVRKETRETLAGEIRKTGTKSTEKP